MENAVRDLTELRAKKQEAEQRLRREHERFQGLLSQHAQVETGLYSAVGRSFAELAAINGDILAIRAIIQGCRNTIANIEEELGDIEKKIVEAREKWRQCERAHDRSNELSEELKKRDMMVALAREEFTDS